ALGQYSVTPALDFERETSFDVPHAMSKQPPKEPSVSVDTSYNPFRQPVSGRREMETLYGGIKEDVRHLVETWPERKTDPVLEPAWTDDLKSEQDDLIFQLHGTYIITQIKTGL